MTPLLLGLLVLSVAPSSHAARNPDKTANSGAKAKNDEAPANANKVDLRSKSKRVDRRAEASSSASGSRVAARTNAPPATEQASKTGDGSKRAPEKARGEARRKKKSSDESARKRANKSGTDSSRRGAASGSTGSTGSDRKISLEEDFLVEGKLEKPNAFFILRRSQAGYDWARLDAKFLPLVLESVQDPLF